MKTKLLAIFLLAAGSAFAGHVSVGVAIGVGGGYGYGYYAAPAPPPPPPVYYAAPGPVPGLGYTWSPGYWYLNSGRYLWRQGYWAPPAYGWHGRYERERHEWREHHDRGRDRGRDRDRDYREGWRR